jgi:hypothetical protein
MSAIALALIVSGMVIVRGALKGLGPFEAFSDIFSRAGGGPGVAVAAPSGIFPGGSSHPTPGLFPPNIEKWRGLVAAHFPAAIVNQALSVMECESEGNPQAMNPISRASGLFQHLPQYWSQRSQAAGVPGANIYDPAANVKVAAWLYRQTGNWSHWSCKPKVGV